jgi:hypothetical protein
VITAKRAYTAARHRAKTRLKEGLVRAHRVPRYAYRHYFIESEGLHSRVHMQNFYSTMWPHLDVSVAVRVELFDASGRSLGTLQRRLDPFGGLFLEVRDALDELGLDGGIPEGTVLVDAIPPREVLDDLTSFPLPDRSELLMGTPFWMAYYDADENYMYVHAISPEMGAYHGVPRPIGRLLIGESARPAGRWRAGRIIDVAGLEEMQIVVVNHAAAPRTTEVGLYEVEESLPIWQSRVELAPHQVQRVRVDRSALDEFQAGRPDGQFRVGMDPLPTSNGKPYLLMRYGDGPLSLHHG